jgi:hypothetical protein
MAPGFRPESLERSLDRFLGCLLDCEDCPVEETASESDGLARDRPLPARASRDSVPRASSGVEDSRVVDRHDTRTRAALYCPETRAWSWQRHRANDAAEWDGGWRSSCASDTKGWTPQREGRNRENGLAAVRTRHWRY